MQRIDADAIERIGIPRILLMDHAGLAVARGVQACTRSSAEPVLICCGHGFNGGDGLSAARHLQTHGIPVRVLLAGRRDELRAESALFAAIVERLGIPVREAALSHANHDADEWLTPCSVIVDALLGIGARGPVREPMASLITHMNRCGKPIIAVDIPSGLDADTGLVPNVAVKATATVTFGLPKQGCFLNQGPAHTGRLTVDPISIPRAVLEAAVQSRKAVQP